MVCKYPRKVLSGEIAESMEEMLLNIARDSHFGIEVMETDKDHVHILVSAPPSLSPLMIVRRLKQESCLRIWEHHAQELRQTYGGGRKSFWTKGYFVSSVGNVSQETIRSYIENQG